MQYQFSCYWFYATRVQIPWSTKTGDKLYWFGHLVRDTAYMGKTVYYILLLRSNGVLLCILLLRLWAFCDVFCYCDQWCSTVYSLTRTKGVLCILLLDYGVLWYIVTKVRSVQCILFLGQRCSTKYYVTKVKKGALYILLLCSRGFYYVSLLRSYPPSSRHCW